MSHTGIGLEVVCDTRSAIRVFTETYDGLPTRTYSAMCLLRQFTATSLGKTTGSWIILLLLLPRYYYCYYWQSLLLLLY